MILWSRCVAICRTSALPNCGSCDEGRSYSTLTEPPSFSITRMLNGTYNAARTSCSVSCVVLSADSKSYNALHQDWPTKESKAP